MVTTEQIIEQRRALEQAKSGMRKERNEKVKGFIKKVIHNVRPKNNSGFMKKVGTRPKSGNPVQKLFMPQSSQGNKTGKVGRPQGILKWRSPLSGQPVKAQQYYKEMRFVRRQQQNIATQRQLQFQQQMARRGMPPQQAQQIQQTQQPQQVQMQPQNIQPQPQQRSIWRDNSYQAQEVGPDGRVKIVTRGAVSSFWN